MALDLRALAEKYETSAFIKEDPCQFLYWYDLNHLADVECASFIAAMLAFGSRKQFIPKIKQILELADKSSGSITKWLLAGAPGFLEGAGNAGSSKKFYRFYSYEDMQTFFCELADIIRIDINLGVHFEKLWKNEGLDKTELAGTSKKPGKNGGRCGGSVPPIEGVAENGVWSEGKTFPFLHQIIAKEFPKSKIVPKGKNSANKRIHMFLRWMVRRNSCVDLGIWDWYDPAYLIMPLDVHVMEEAKKIGLLEENATASFKTAFILTKKLHKIFTDDPVKADFALFGLGVDGNFSER